MSRGARMGLLDTYLPASLFALEEVGSDTLRTYRLLDRGFRLPFFPISTVILFLSHPKNIFKINSYDYFFFLAWKIVAHT